MPTFELSPPSASGSLDRLHLCASTARGVAAAGLCTGAPGPFCFDAEPQALDAFFTGCAMCLDSSTGE